MTTRNLLKTLLISILAIALFACADDGSSAADTDPGQKAESTAKPQKADQWNWTNNPDRFQIEFDHKFEALVQNEEAVADQIPWPSDYWSYYQDSINVRYDGNELSPVEKYDMAFNGWAPNDEHKPMDVSADCEDKVIVLDETQTAYYDNLGPAANWQHQYKGNYKAHDGIDNDNDGETDECGGDDYDGIESWWGLCHAWVPAAILEPEPQKSVTVNGVTFSTSDIKALLIAQYDKASAHMLGGRCNAKEVERDDTGRPKDVECRDTNPGAFFVVITNMLGIHKRAFAEDRTLGYQVWNQPILGYEIYEHKELTEEEAMTRLEHEGEKFHEVFNSPEAVAWQYVRMGTDYITESNNTDQGPLIGSIHRWTKRDNYEMVLEIDADGNVVGGEWVNYSQNTHPDFLWLPYQGHGGNPHMNIAKIRELNELSRKEEVTVETPDLELHEFTDDAEIDIPDNDPVGISRTITVDQDIDIASLKLTVDIEHTYVGDLQVILERGDTKVTLHDRTGGASDNLQTSFDVTDFAGQNAKGDWTLLITDNAAADAGLIMGWTLVIGAGFEVTEPEIRSFDNTDKIEIPDNDTAGITSTITVPSAAAGTVRGLKVTVNITHTFVGDLVLTLTSGAQSQIFYEAEGGSSDNIEKTFTLEGFAGAPANADWILKVQDRAKMDIGNLDSWSLHVQY